MDHCGAPIDHLPHPLSNGGVCSGQACEITEAQMKAEVNRPTIVGIITADHVDGYANLHFRDSGNGPTRMWEFQRCLYAWSDGAVTWIKERSF